MNNETEMLFSDGTVTYEQFVNDLATRITSKMHQAENLEKEISKAKAYKMFGRADVDRWIKGGKIYPSRISPGITRYKLVDLQKLASVKQNYLL